MRYSPRRASHDLTIDLGFTNAIGGTTGFSMTPGLSNSTAVYLSVTCRR